MTNAGELEVVSDRCVSVNALANGLECISLSFGQECEGSKSLNPMLLPIVKTGSQLLAR
jgi:hypothetical protein